MERHMTLTHRLTMLAAVALLAACAPDADSSPDRTTPMNAPSPRINKLFAQTRPVCFGRFVIDLPATAQVVWGPSSVDDDIASYPGEGYKLRAEITAKEKELKEEKHIREPSTYIGTFDGPNQDSKIVVGYSDFESSGLVQLNSYIRLGKHGYVQSAKSAALGRDKAGIVNKTGYQRYVAEMQDVARRLRVRGEDEVPADPGICIDSGFVAEDAGRYYELISTGFRFPEYPDVSFSVMTIKSNRVNPDDSLEVALREAKDMAKEAGEGRWYSQIKTLRHGKREMGGWEGSEQLARLPPQPKTKGKPSYHEFVFKSIGVANDVFRPYVNMEMSTGVDENDKGEVPPSLKDEEAVALWDTLTRSIRVRPIRSPAASAAPGQPDPKGPSAQASPRTALPLGTPLASGARCPQAGLWQCAEANAIGGDKRAFTVGETFPSVLVPTERGFLARLKGEAPNQLTPTTWTLVGQGATQDGNARS
jgi:hypothetical protein